MNFRTILSPVFVVEWVVNARKWHGYAARFAFGLALLAAISFAAWMIGNIGSKQDMVSVQNLAAFGEFIFNVMGTVQILMILLAAPAATAGAICQDRARGALLHMMVTDLSVAEIVIGKLAARLVPILCLVLCSFPVLALSSLLGGIDPRAIVLLLTISLALAVLGCSLALTLSLWMKNSYEVMVGVISSWTLGLLAAPTWYLLATPLKLGAMPTALLAANPFYLMHEIYSQAGYPVVAHVIAFVLGSLIISGILVVLATRSFRAAVEQDGKTRNKYGMLRRLRRAACWRGPDLDESPVLWRECHRSRPSRLAQVSGSIFAILATTAMAISIIALWHAGVARGPRLTIPELTVLNALIVTLGFLLVAVGSPTALAEERVRGSLDILLSTPLSTRAILLGKWRGAYRIVPWLTVFPMASAIAMVCLTPTSSQPAKPLPAGMMAVGDDLMLVDRGLYLIVALSQTLSMGAVITSLGLALATWTSRVGRAIAANVAIYLVFAVLWPLGLAILAETLNLPSLLGLDVEYEVLFAGGTSPFVDALGRDISLLADLKQINRGFLLELEMAWSLIFLVVAYLLFEFSVWTFDRRLGRIPDRGAGRRLQARLPKLARPTLVAEPTAQASR